MTEHTNPYPNEPSRNGHDLVDPPDPGTGALADPADNGSHAGSAHTPAEPTEPAEPGVVVPPRPTVTPASKDPDRWGRIDSDGTVFVTGAEAERAVGSWQAGTASEGLAHFARRFDDLLTEAELIESRLAAGASDPKQALNRVDTLRGELADAAVVGDLSGLGALLDYLHATAHAALADAKAAREQAKADAVTRKEKLAAEAESIGAESTQWKASGDRLRAILDEWKTIKGIDRKTDDALWRRFSKARDAFNRRRGAHFAELDRQRAGAKQRKEELVEQAEALAESTDWGPTASRYRALMAEWKAAGRAPKDVDDALWARFRAAQDRFFGRRAATFSERDAERVHNAETKEALLAEAEKIDTSGDLDEARAHLRRIQERWEAGGRVPRERSKELEGRLRAVEERIRAATDSQWRRTDPEAEARVAQFRERVEQFEAQVAKAKAAGDERKARRAQEQADQWREWLAAAERAVATR